MKRLLEQTEKLKHLARTGWLRHGIEVPETVAAHSWQMAMMAMQLSGTMLKTPYDYNKVIRMCLCHDLGESLIGDITPFDKRYQDKDENEKKAIDYIAQYGDIPEIIHLFTEYQQNETPEARLANDLDKLDMYAQSLDYEQKFMGKDLSEFRRSAKAVIKTPIGRAILHELEQNE